LANIRAEVRRRSAAFKRAGRPAGAETADVSGGEGQAGGGGEGKVEGGEGGWWKCFVNSQDRLKYRDSLRLHPFCVCKKCA
jgi:hypothetical protein